MQRMVATRQLTILITCMSARRATTTPPNRLMMRNFKTHNRNAVAAFDQLSSQSNFDGWAEAAARVKTLCMESSNGYWAFNAYMR